MNWFKRDIFACESSGACLSSKNLQVLKAMSRKMKTLKYVSLLLITFAFIMGCSGTSGKLKTQSENDSKVTQRELIDNWSDYDIWHRDSALIFAPKNDDRKILLGGNRGWWWHTIKDQETWTEFVKANMTSQGNFRPVGADYSMTSNRFGI